MGVATGGTYFNSAGRARRWGTRHLHGPRPGSQPVQRPGTAFAKAVLRRVRAVPRGRVTTYGDVATALGRPSAARAVGAVIRTAEEPGVPYHRVVGADGKVGGAGPGGQGEGAQDRARRLRAEGLRIAPDGRIAGFARVRWPGNDQGTGGQT
ncbi:MAG: methylated-DNA-[protein]-cysteine S-methyltransferase [Thermoplasmata archaeon]|nr:methylated-DNA-[protein]-cysteine S-methyltransferase [Thermoplasmata archaeon]